MDLDGGRQNADDSVCALSFHSLKAGDRVSAKVETGASLRLFALLLCGVVDAVLRLFVSSKVVCVVWRPFVSLSAGFGGGWSLRGPPVFS